MNKDRRSKVLFIGVGLIVVGLVLVLERLAIYSGFIHTYLYRWESALILIGLLLVFVRRRFIEGFITFGAGAYFLLDDFYFLSPNWKLWFFPVLLIAGGLIIIFAPKLPNCNK